MPKPPRLPPNQTLKIRTAASRTRVAQSIDPGREGYDLPLQSWIRPCLPTLVDKPPVGDDWIHEIKWDGYRISAYVAAGKVTIRTRNGHDWTSRFPSIAAG